MGWDGRAQSGILVGNPIGWILRNVNSSFALYKDNGVRRFEKVVLALRPGRKILILLMWRIIYVVFMELVLLS